MYLVIGGNGYLGSYIIKSILAKTAQKIIATARNIYDLSDTKRITWLQCDISNEEEFDGVIKRVKDRDDVNVVFLAAYHHPDLVAANPQIAWDINVTDLSRCINKLGFVRKLFYASTDSVYGNSIDGYHFKETDQLSPVNIYGHNKAAAEAIVANYGFNVVRYPFLIAPSLVRGKKHFYDYIVEDLQNGKCVEMFEDSYRSSLNFMTAADILIDLFELKGDSPAIVNICGDSDLSKYDIGLMIADKLHVDRDMIRPIRVSDDETVFKTPRALSTLMDNTLVKELLGMERIDFVI